MQSIDEEIPEESVLRKITSAIRWAQHDKKIKGIVIQTDNLEGADLSKLDAITQAINSFKESKKPVIAVGDNFSQGQCYLASVADKIYLNPMGSVQLYGFGAYQSYLKGCSTPWQLMCMCFAPDNLNLLSNRFYAICRQKARENLAQWINEQWSFIAQHH
ncbi:MAG: S49 family peptidase [Pseudomonadales bacterium]